MRARLGRQILSHCVKLIGHAAPHLESARSAKLAIYCLITYGTNAVLNAQVPETAANRIDSHNLLSHLKAAYFGKLANVDVHRCFSAGLICFLRY